MMQIGCNGGPPSQLLGRENNHRSLRRQTLLSNPHAYLRSHQQNNHHLRKEIGLVDDFLATFSTGRLMLLPPIDNQAKDGGEVTMKLSLCWNPESRPMDPETLLTAKNLRSFQPSQEHPHDPSAVPIS
jgi:hypothetical protein